jgi:transcription initiation factor TFIID TATA-box-binding protein
LWPSHFILHPSHLPIDISSLRGEIVIKFKIENVVAQSETGVKFNLQQLANNLENIEYEPASFPGLIYHAKDPDCAVIFFNNGKIVFTGIKSPEGINKVMNKLNGELKELGFEIPGSPDIVIQNIVTSYELNKLLNLNSIAITLGKERAEYEPEKFEGLVYRNHDPSVSTLLFRSGKIICTGARNLSDAEAAIDALVKDLESTGLMN